jgi:hypothetical protein
MLASYNCQFIHVRDQIMKTLLYIAFLVASLVAGVECCRAQTDSFGIVKTVSGEVLVSRSEKTMKAAPNMKIIQGDSIKTGEKGSIGLVFSDDTVIALDPNSEIMIESYMFSPVDQELSFVAKLIKGTFSFITGQIAKLAPKNVKFETPDATLGVRGTKLLVKID